MTRFLVVSALVFAFAACLTGCKRRAALVERDLVAEAEALMADRRWGEAIPLLKQRLLSDPDDAGAHFYLGRCYINAKESRHLAIAEGELETALSIFVRKGRESPIPRFSARYFEFICHVETMHVVLEQIVFLLEHGAPDPILAHYAEKAESVFEEARSIVPSGPDIENMKSMLEEVRGLLRDPARPVLPIRPIQPIQPTPGLSRHVRSPATPQRNHRGRAQFV